MGVRLIPQMGVIDIELEGWTPMRYTCRGGDNDPCVMMQRRALYRLSRIVQVLKGPSFNKHSTNNNTICSRTWLPNKGLLLLRVKWKEHLTIRF